MRALLLALDLAVNGAIAALLMIGGIHPAIVLAVVLFVSIYVPTPWSRKLDAKDSASPPGS